MSHKQHPYKIIFRCQIIINFTLQVSFLSVPNHTNFLIIENLISSFTNPNFRTVPNDLRFWLFMHFKKVSRKETVFNQSNGRKFKNSLFAQGNSLTEQRDYFWIFWAKRLFSNFLPFDWLKTVSFTKNSLWDKISID